MAERIAETHSKTRRTVVGILGKGHVEGRNGVPHQLADLGITGSMVLLPWDRDRPCAELDGRIADAVYGLDPVPEAEPPRQRLGVVVEADGDGMRIRSVQENGIAAAAGLKPGDLLITAAGVPIGRAADLTEVVERQAPGTWLPLMVKRDGKPRSLIAKFPAR
jgi:hypothetical protein